MTPLIKTILLIVSLPLLKCQQHQPLKYSTLTDNVAMDTKTLASIVTDIDSHYDHLLTYYNNQSDQHVVGDAPPAAVAVGWTEPGTSLTWDSSLGQVGEGHVWFYLFKLYHHGN